MIKIIRYGNLIPNKKISLKILSEITETILLNNNKWSNLQFAVLGIRLVSIIKDTSDLYGEKEFFTPESLNDLFFKVAKLELGNNLSNCVLKTEKGSKLSFTDKEEIKVICRHRNINDLYEFSEWFGNLIKKYYGNFLKLIKINEDNLSFESEEHITFESDIANKLIVEINNSTKNRSFLIYGNPGSGKTSIARHIGKKLGTYIFINLSELFKSNDNLLESPEFLLKEIILCLKPKVLILDDLDWFFDLENLFHVIDSIKELVPVIIGTANELKNIPKPLLRPQRFDRLIHLKSNDKNRLKNLFQNISIDISIFEKIKNWPHSYIEELKNRIALINNDWTSHIVDQEICDLESQLKLSNSDEDDE